MPATAPTPSDTSPATATASGNGYSPAWTRQENARL